MNYIYVFFSDVSGISCDKVVVISIIGKSACNSFGLKVKTVGRVIPPRDINEDQEVNSNKRIKIEFTGLIIYLQCVIEGSYDEENQIVYLHMCSPLDTDTLVKKYAEIRKNCETDRHCDDFLAVYDEIKSTFARYLLLLFHVSHIVVLSHPGCTLDTNYIQYFKAIDSLRYILIFDVCK